MIQDAGLDRFVGQGDCTADAVFGGSPGLNEVILLPPVQAGDHDLAELVGFKLGHSAFRAHGNDLVYAVRLDEVHQRAVVTVCGRMGSSQRVLLAAVFEGTVGLELDPLKRRAVIRRQLGDLQVTGHSEADVLGFIINLRVTDVEREGQEVHIAAVFGKVAVEGIGLYLGVTGHMIRVVRHDVVSAAAVREREDIHESAARSVDERAERVVERIRTLQGAVLVARRDVFAGIQVVLGRDVQRVAFHGRRCAEVFKYEVSDRLTNAGIRTPRRLILGAACAETFVLDGEGNLAGIRDHNRTVVLNSRGTDQFLDDRILAVVAAVAAFLLGGVPVLVDPDVAFDLDLLVHQGDGHGAGLLNTRILFVEGVEAVRGVLECAVFGEVAVVVVGGDQCAEGDRKHFVRFDLDTAVKDHDEGKDLCLIDIGEIRRPVAVRLARPVANALHDAYVAFLDLCDYFGDLCGIRDIGSRVRLAFGDVAASRGDVVPHLVRVRFHAVDVNRAERVKDVVPLRLTETVTHLGDHITDDHILGDIVAGVDNQEPIHMALRDIVRLRHFTDGSGGDAKLRVAVEVGILVALDLLGNGQLRADHNRDRIGGSDPDVLVAVRVIRLLLIALQAVVDAVLVHAGNGRVLITDAGAGSRRDVIAIGVVLAEYVSGSGLIHGEGIAVRVLRGLGGAFRRGEIHVVLDLHGAGQLVIEQCARADGSVEDDIRRFARRQAASRLEQDAGFGIVVDNAVIACDLALDRLADDDLRLFQRQRGVFTHPGLVIVKTGVVEGNAGGQDIQRDRVDEGNLASCTVADRDRVLYSLPGNSFVA